MLEDMIKRSGIKLMLNKIRADVQSSSAQKSENNCIDQKIVGKCDELVSIIMPLHNDELYVEGAINSVLSQSYQNWELLIIDDYSTDHSPQIIQDYSQMDRRIRLFRTEQPSGSPTKPRNIGIENAKGRYIAFLDSDDQWLPSKLENQLMLFNNNEDAIMVFSNYKKISEDGEIHHRPIIAPSETDYYRMLKGNIMGCLSIMYDTEKVGKSYFPKCGHEDYALWLSILKKGGKAYNTNTVEALYRVKGNSVSSNKLIAMGWQWNIYRNIEKIGFVKSSYYFANYAIKALFKRMK